MKERERIKMSGNEKRVQQTIRDAFIQSFYSIKSSVQISTFFLDQTLCLLIRIKSIVERKRMRREKKPPEKERKKEET